MLPSHLSVDVASTREAAADRFTEFVRSPTFPCVGARSAVNKQRMRFGRYASMCGLDAVDALQADLEAFSLEFPEPGEQPVSFVAMFDEPVQSEAQFDARGSGSCSRPFTSATRPRSTGTRRSVPTHHARTFRSASRAGRSSSSG